LDEKKIKTIINRLSKSYRKKDSVKDLGKIMYSITSLLKNPQIVEKLHNFVEENKENMPEYARLFFYKNGKITLKELEDTLLARVKRYGLSVNGINELSKKELLDVLQINNTFKADD